MLGRRNTFPAIAAFAVVLASAEGARAQACLGFPIPAGSYGVRTGVGFGDDFTSYGASLAGNAEGRWSFAGGYSLMANDETRNAHGFFGRVSLELEAHRLSLCPFTGVRYVRTPGDEAFGRGTESSFLLPFGIGLVHPFPIPLGATVTPYVTPQFLVRLADVDEDTEANGKGNTGFGIRKGVSVRVQRFFGGLDIELTSFGDEGPVYRISFGMRL